MNKLEEEFKDLIYLNSSKDDGKYFLNLAQLDQVGEQSAKMTTNITTKFLLWVLKSCNYNKERGFREYFAFWADILRVEPNQTLKTYTAEELFEIFLKNERY